MAKSYQKSKGRKSTPRRFLALPYNLLASENYLNLSFYARSLLNDVAMQYDGSNNGDLCIAWSLMEKRGWKSKASLNKFRKELIDNGFLVMARQGRKGVASLYAITWQPIDECEGKLEISPTRVPTHDWKN